MFTTLRNAWQIPELRKKLIFTAMIMLLYRIGNFIPVPFIDASMMSAFFENTLNDTILGLYNAMSGSAFSQATVFALGIQPYINASIIIQLLTIAIPALERLAKEGGEEGKKKIQAITRYATVAIAVLSAIGYYMLMKNYGLLTANGTGIWPALVIIVSFVAGSAFVMWLGEQITEFGVGNGISMILFAGIISRIPSAVSTGYATLRADPTKWWAILLVVVGVLALIVLIVWVNGAERRIPVQYAKRQVGRKMYGGQSSTLPMKVNMSGVMPVIFASSIVSIPATIAGFFPDSGFAKWVTKWFSYTSVFYIALFIVLIFAFAYFYIMISFNPVEVANNIRSQGGSVPGIRPGKPTSDYIKKILNRITLLGAIFLVVIAGVPMIVNAITTAFHVSFSSIAFGGTSLLIIVGVALEVVRDIEAQLAMRNYKGFLD